jgi:uncharacterized spore protein YtfJ
MNEHADAIAQQLDKALDRLNIKAVFGEPLREGEATLIPVAEMTMGFGYGYGSGPAPKPEEAAPEEAGDETPPAGQVQTELAKEVGGGGAGGGGKARPLGYIQIDADGVRFKSIEDETRLGLAGIAMVAWCVFWVAVTIRSAIKKCC